MLRRTPVRSLAAILLCSMIDPQVVLACSCASPLLEDRFNKSDNVFTAYVTGGEVVREGVVDRAGLVTWFEVTEVFKGTIPFTRFSSHADGGTCGTSLQVGIEYLVFAADTGQIGLCSGIVPVSGFGGDDPEAVGLAYVSALRSFKAGIHDGLAEPWQFSADHGVCHLSARFPYGVKRWPANIAATYRTTRSESSASHAEPHLEPGYTEMSIRVPEDSDLSDHPMTIVVDDLDYIAKRSRDEYSRGRYLLNTHDVPGLIAKLVDASTLRVRSSRPGEGDIEAEAALINVGDSVSKMHACIEGAAAD